MITTRPWRQMQRIASLYHANLNALNDTKLKAPFDGYVQKKFFDAHEIVNIGTPVLSMNLIMITDEVKLLIFRPVILYDKICSRRFLVQLMCFRDKFSLWS